MEMYSRFLRKISHKSPTRASLESANNQIKDQMRDSTMSKSEMVLLISKDPRSKRETSLIEMRRDKSPMLSNSRRDRGLSSRCQLTNSKARANLRKDKNIMVSNSRGERDLSSRCPKINFRDRANLLRYSSIRAL